MECGEESVESEEVEQKVEWRAGESGVRGEWREEGVEG